MLCRDECLCFVDLALQQGIMTPEQMQNLRPPAKSRKSSTKKSRKASKVTAETREDIRVR